MSDHWRKDLLMNEAGTAELFRPVETGRVSAQIVERVTEAIRQGQLSVGDRLPSERELTERLNVSRVTVRDALRILEARGLIEIRVGARGGAFISAPMPNMVAEGLTHMLMLSDLSPGEVTEARQVFELGLIPLVCERADEQDIADLGDICDRSESALLDGTFEMHLSAQFHVRLARATHNHAVELMTDALQGPLLSSLRGPRRSHRTWATAAFLSTARSSTRSWHATWSTPLLSCEDTSSAPRSGFVVSPALWNEPRRL